MYTCFKRAWWRYQTNSQGKRELVPNPGARKTYLATFDKESEAREFCQRFNSDHNPGPLSIKAEYTSGGI